MRLEFRLFFFFFFLITMWRLKTLHPKLPLCTLARRGSAVRLPRSTGQAAIKSMSTAATVVATQQQKTRYLSNVWKTSAVLATLAITYGLSNNNAFALEANDCNDDAKP